MGTPAPAGAFRGTGDGGLGEHHVPGEHPVPLRRQLQGKSLPAAQLLHKVLFPPVGHPGGAEGGLHQRIDGGVVLLPDGPYGVRDVRGELLGQGRTDVALKGKVRTILLPRKLCRKLLTYAKRRGIAAGEIFSTRNGTGLCRKQIWHEMKSLCAAAGVAPSKVFPHNLRHLFATAFYRATRDIVKLADVLGHSSVDTTRIYLMTTGAEHARQLERLGLIS